MKRAWRRRLINAIMAGTCRRVTVHTVHVGAWACGLWCVRRHRASRIHDSDAAALPHDAAQLPSQPTSPGQTPCCKLYTVPCARRALPRLERRPTAHSAPHLRWRVITLIVQAFAKAKRNGNRCCCSSRTGTSIEIDGLACVATLSYTTCGELAPLAGHPVPSCQDAAKMRVLFMQVGSCDGADAVGAGHAMHLACASAKAAVRSRAPSVLRAVSRPLASPRPPPARHESRQPAASATRRAQPP